MQEAWKGILQKMRKEVINEEASLRFLSENQ